MQQLNQFDRRTRQLLDAPVVPTLLMMAIPNALVMFAQVAIALVEIYFLARLGVDVLAGVSLVFPVLAWVGAVSQGAVGGGVVTAIARALGRGDRELADKLVWYALVLAVALGLLTTIVILWIGPRFYAGMGAHGASLSAALTYSHLIFSGAILIWTFNLMLAAVRGTGNMMLPMVVVCGGAVALVPLSALLIFGYSWVPAFGVTGGAIAILLYYAVGSFIFIFHLWGRSGVLQPSYVPPRLEWRPILEILRVGGLSAIVSSTTNLTIAIITGFVASAGVAALAGYGTGARLEFLLVPLSYGIGGPAGIMIGTNIGAGRIDRALKVAWTTVLLAGLTAESIGLAAAIWPEVWIGAFSRDAGVIAARLGLSQDGWPDVRLFRHRIRDVLRRSGHRRNEMAGCRRLCAGGGGDPGRTRLSPCWSKRALDLPVGRGRHGELRLPRPAGIDQAKRIRPERERDEMPDVGCANGSAFESGRTSVIMIT